MFLKITIFHKVSKCTKALKFGWLEHCNKEVSLFSYLEQRCAVYGVSVFANEKSEPLVFLRKEFHHVEMLDLLKVEPWKIFVYIYRGLGWKQSKVFEGGGVDWIGLGGEFEEV